MYPSVNVLKSILVKEDYVSEADANAAEQHSTDSAGFVDYLLREQLISKTLLGQAIASGFKLPYADLEKEPPTKDTADRIPAEVAKASRAVFVKAEGNSIVVATDDPSKIDAHGLAAAFPQHKVHLAYTLPEFVESALGLYEQPLGTRFSQIAAGGQRVAPEIVDEIIKDAVTYRASDIHFEPRGKIVEVRFRIDGTLREAGKIPSEYYENILNRVKVESGMRIDEHLAAQDGAIGRQTEHGNLDLRVSLVPTVEGEKVVMRVLGSYVQSFTLADIGLDDQHRQMLERFAKKPFGMILTVGPTGSGKTTTLYALVKLLNAPDINITSIEDPVEYKIAGINQIQVREQTNLTFAKGLRSIVRQDPNVILVGEIRDKETAEISVNAALTGHLLLSTFHANDAATAVPRLIEMGVEPFLVASTIEAVIAQRLVRRICASCRASQSAADAFKNISVDTSKLYPYFKPDDTVYYGAGCNICNHTGYVGRTALFEFIEITPEIQDLLLKNPSASEIAELAKSQGSQSMFDDGIIKVKSGATTIAEVLRVVEPPNKPPTTKHAKPRL